MTLIEQVFSDLRKEIGWVLFYGVLTTVVLMSFILFGLTTGDMISRSEALGRFVAEDISMARLHSIRFNISPKSDPAQDAPEEKESWDTYCTDVFSESGNAGTYVIMPGRDGYQLIILLLGIYADLTPFSRPQSEAVTFAISYDQKEKKGDNISVEGKQFPLYLAPADMEIFHPLRYINGKFGTLDNTLYVFSRDLKAVQEIFLRTNTGN